MPRDVDELFGGGTGQPTPRTRLVIGLLVAGVLLAILGMVCSAAPGGLMVLVAWMVVEKELDRVETGYLPPEVLPELRGAQRLVWVGVGLVIALFVAQALLFCSGFYTNLWEGALQSLVAWLT